MSKKEKSLSDPGNSKGSNPMLLASPALAILISWFFHHFGEMETEAVITLGIAIWTALWWIFEAVPDSSRFSPSSFPTASLWSFKSKSCGRKIRTPTCPSSLWRFSAFQSDGKKWCS
jgi:hypothetical protein